MIMNWFRKKIFINFTNLKQMNMKKMIFAAFIGLMGLSAVSCKRCAECSTKDNIYYTGEYCKGNAFQNAVYNSAKAECESAGGKFK